MVRVTFLCRGAVLSTLEVLATGRTRGSSVRLWSSSNNNASGLVEVVSATFTFLAFRGCGGTWVDVVNTMPSVMVGGRESLCGW
jgi:hypothetical protein